MIHIHQFIMRLMIIMLLTQKQKLRCSIITFCRTAKSNSNAKLPKMDIRPDQTLTNVKYLINYNAWILTRHVDMTA